MQPAVVAPAVVAVAAGRAAAGGGAHAAGGGAHARSVVGTLPPAAAYAGAVPLGAPVPNGSAAAAAAQPASPDELTQETMPIPVYDPAPADRPPARGR
jgi:hypothetical protein